ncbi:gamma-2-syntrophin isoform X3 [Mus musculus]|nr:gamma-2-syntrophin isoform X3 [Mus musculus]|eukprot:XP_011242175.1 PREDICTED: gamma-2-syntrophin isoform X4 [Mus musculus]
MGWVNERLQGADNSQNFRPKFLALRGSSFYIFGAPPVSTLDWGRAERAYNLCEVLFKVHKFWLSDNYWLQANLYLGLQDFDCEDPRSYCFSVLANHGKSHIFSVELGSELAVWEKAFQRATFMEVQRTGSKTYLCSWQGETLCFTVDFALGFTCFDGKTKNVLWRFKFSQLKGSSDDGKTRVKLLFQNLDTKQIETKVVTLLMKRNQGQLNDLGCRKSRDRDTIPLRSSAWFQCSSESFYEITDSTSRASWAQFPSMFLNVSVRSLFTAPGDE